MVLLYAIVHHVETCSEELLDRSQLLALFDHRTGAHHHVNVLRRSLQKRSKRLAGASS